MKHYDKNKYKEFIKSEIIKAIDDGNFNKNGNSCLAISNRSFVHEIIMQIKEINSTIFRISFLKELAIGMLTLITFISLPVTYIPIVFLKTWLTRKKTKKTMLKYYFQKIGELK